MKNENIYENSANNRTRYKTTKKKYQKKIINKQKIETERQIFGKSKKDIFSGDYWLVKCHY